MSPIRARVNGSDHSLEVPPTMPLLHVLRNHLGLRGAKFGCGLEQCGACAVLIDGISALSCTLPVGRIEGKSVTTVEGLARGDELSMVQQAFVDAAAAQCGYCTPGLLIAVTALFTASARPSPEQVDAVLAGHLCRCGSQPRVLAAIRALSDENTDDNA